MGSEGLTCEQENLEVHGGVALRINSAPSSRPMIHDIQQLLLFVTHGDYSFGRLPPRQPFPASFFVHHGISSSSSSPLSPILFTAGIYFPRVLLHNQGYPKVCPNPLNLSNAGDSFAGISSLTSCYLFSRTRDLIATF
jgi:hypothetical protein